MLTNNQNLVFMKTLISLLSLGAIYWSYYILTNPDNYDAITPENQPSFSQFESDLKPLEKLNYYQVITNKPLFDEDREPEKKVVKIKKVVKAPVVNDLKVQALGIALSSDGIIAVIKDLKNGKILRLRINEEVYGWILKGVSQEEFTFSRNGIEKTINFKNDRG